MNLQCNVHLLLNLIASITFPLQFNVPTYYERLHIVALSGEYIYSQPSIMRNPFIRKPRYPDRISRNGHAFTTALTIFRYPENRYPEDIFKVPKVPDK